MSQSVSFSRELFLSGQQTALAHLLSGSDSWLGQLLCLSARLMIDYTSSLPNQFVHLNVEQIQQSEDEVEKQGSNHLECDLGKSSVFSSIILSLSYLALRRGVCPFLSIQCKMLQNAETQETVFAERIQQPSHPLFSDVPSIQLLKEFY